MSHCVVMANFIDPPWDPGQPFLLPPSLLDLIPPDDPVLAFDELLERLDYASLYASYHETGRPAYDPKLMFKLLVYAYRQGVTSSRDIAGLARTDVRFMVLCKGCRPDFRTVSLFRKQKAGYFGALFESSVRLCQKLGLVSLSVVSVDGTKMRANAGKGSCKSEEQVDAQLQLFSELLARSERDDAVEDALFGDGDKDELPRDLRDKGKRKERLEEAKRRLEEEGRKKVPVTDPESRVMKTGKEFAPCYNGQIGVDSERQVVVAADVVREENDHEQLPRMAEEMERVVGGRAATLLADTGYCDEATLSWAKERSQELLVPPQGSTHERKRDPWFRKGCFLYVGGKVPLVCPMGEEVPFWREVEKGAGLYFEFRKTGCQACEFQRECVGRAGSKRVLLSSVEMLKREQWAKLRSPGGQSVYRWRGSVERAIGDIKENAGARRFRVRGLLGAKGEFHLMCVGHNLQTAVRAGCGALDGVRALIRVSHRAVVAPLRSLLGRVKAAVTTLTRALGSAHHAPRVFRHARTNPHQPSLPTPLPQNAF